MTVPRSFRTRPSRVRASRGGTFWARPTGSAQNGEVVGTVKPGGNGGWLVLDRSYQDVGFFANFRCTGGCRTGILFRAEKTAEGLKGIYVSLNEGDVASYRVTLGADGQELHREPLRPPAPAERAVADVAAGARRPQRGWHSA